MGEWISVKERTPPPSTDAEYGDTYMTFPHYAILHWFPGGWFRDYDEEHDMWVPPKWEVTHWMPLPEPPKGDE